MLKELYLDIATKLSLLKDADDKPVLKHIELFNNQFMHLAEIKPLSSPCCLIEFTDIPFEQMGGKVQQANTLIRLHIGSHGLQDNKFGSAGHIYTLDHLDLVDTVHNWMSGFNGDGFNSFVRTGLAADQDHDSIIVHVITYRTRVTDNGAVRPTVKVSGDKFAIEVI